MTDPKRALLRHTIATLAYRGEKCLREVPPSFAAYSASPGTRSPAEILAHIGDLLDWALWLCNGEHRWRTAAPLPWETEVARFFAGLEQLDLRLGADTPLGCSEEALFQGPIADALTHVGQLAILRRMAGAPVRGENYFRAEIVAGRTGPAQGSTRVEFD